MDSVSLDKTKNTVFRKGSKTFTRTNNSGKAGKAGKTKSDNSKKRSKKKRRFNGKAKGVVYLGHIPHGFYENEMKSYFSQFGKVLATKVVRSKKTGRSRGYGFIEFADEEVAKIAAETMNNYLMFSKILKCRYITPEERKGKIFVRTINVNEYPRKINRRTNEKNKIKALSQLNQDTYLKKAQDKINEFRKFFEERGINFTFRIKGESDENSKDMINETQPETAFTNGIESESEDETDDQFGVLEIDESDNEINFKTPPQVKKVIKRFVSSSVPLNESTSSKNSQTGKKIKMISFKNSNLDKSKSEKNKAKSDLAHIRQKQKTKKKLSANLKTKNVASVMKQKNSKKKRNINK